LLLSVKEKGEGAGGGGRPLPTYRYFVYKTKAKHTPKAIQLCYALHSRAVCPLRGRATMYVGFINALPYKGKA